MVTDRRDIRLWTALRGIAAVAVVLYHFHIHVATDIVAWPLIGPIVANGDMGVDMFFVLSGFVITYVYWVSAPLVRRDLADFYVRRLARIYPVHLVTTMAAAAMLILGASLGLGTVDEAKMAMALPVHLLLLHGIGTNVWATLNYPSWSVSSEMLAYLVFPAFAYLLRRHVPAWLTALTSVTMIVIGLDLTSLAAIGAWRVLPEFLLGMSLCVGIDSYRNRTLGLALVSAGFGAFVLVVNLGGPRSVAVLALTTAVCGAFVGNRPDARTNRFEDAFLYLGKISYSIYMVHALVEAPGFKIAQKLTGAPEDKSPSWVLAVMIVVTIAAAAALFHLVEQPARRTLVKRYEARQAKR